MGTKKKQRGFALPLVLIIVLGVASFFIQVVFNSGSNKKDKCEYDIRLLPAEVFDVDTVSDGYCEIWLKLDRDGKQDTLRYSSEFSGFASFEQIKRSHLVKGEIFKYIIKDLKRGDCDTHVEALLLERY